MLMIRAAGTFTPTLPSRLIPGAVPPDALFCLRIRSGASALTATNNKEEIPLVIRQLEHL